MSSALVVAVISGMALASIASYQPTTSSTQTVMASKVDLITPFHVHHLKLEKCALEDCSDTPQNL